ncbi:MAG: hypothetical protein PHR26_01850 [Candidatus ainarchaeum sp.]|nr:hypothetical protein [Candidatus ainarchaeum sp.]MDD3975966.1 hypothetical protein [Candidatus ainarchaeum sp.]
MFSEKGKMLSFLGPIPMIFKIIIVIIIGVLIIPGAMVAFPVVKYLMMGIIVFFIYETIVNSIGKGILAYILTGVLAYFLVYKYLYLTASITMLYLFLGFGLISTFIWGTSTLSRKK